MVEHVIKILNVKKRQKIINGLYTVVHVMYIYCIFIIKIYSFIFL